MVTRTLAIIKPDAVENAFIGRIVDRIEEDGRIKITGMKWEHMTEERAMEFYAEHQGRPYFEKLVRFMTSGPCLAVALKCEAGTDAIVWWRSVLKDIRARYSDAACNPAKSERNYVHGSDSAESAMRELSFFRLI